MTYDDTAEWITSLVGRDGQPAGTTTRREVGLLRQADGVRSEAALAPRQPYEEPSRGHRLYSRPQKMREHVYLSMPQLVYLAVAAGEYSLFIMLAGTGGLRWREVTALTADDVQLGDRPTMSVSKAYVEVGGKLLLGPTKGGDNRVVPLPRLIGDRLAPVVAERAPGERLFSGSRGSALRNNTWTRRHYGPAIAAVAATDPTFPRPTFHDLRHTAVSLAISAGVNVKVVQRIAGHASATMTLDTYAGLFDDDLHGSADRLNRALTGLGWT